VEWESSTEEEILLELASLDATNFMNTLRRVLAIDARTVAVERVNLWFFDRAPPSIVCEQGYVASEDRYESGARLMERDHPRYFASIRESKILAADDARSDPRTRGFLHSYLEPLGITSMMDAPVWLHGSLVGVLCHEHVGPPRRWSAREKQMGIFVAQTLARTLEARQRARAVFLWEATRLLADTLHLSDVPHRFTRLTVPMVGEWCVVDIFEDGVLRRLAGTHVDPRRRDLLDELTPTRLGPPFAAVAALRENKPLLFRDLDPSSLHALSPNHAQAELLRTLGAHTVMAVPFSAHGRVLGVATLGSGDPARRYSSSDLETARLIAERAAVAVENARLHHEVEEALRLREEFLSIAAHELYTPIQSLQLAVDALSGNAGELSRDAARRSLAVAQRQVRRLGRLVDDLLSVTRIRTGHLVLSLEEVDLRAVVRDVVAQSARELEQSGSVIQIVADDAIVGRWDRGRLEQVVSNLLGNAIKFGGGEPITVRVEREGSGCRLAVHNRGAVIDPDQIRTIFEPFRRAVSSHRYGGLGLGLYIVRQIVEAHHGSIRAQSSEEAGTTFLVELPCAGPALPAPAPAAPEPAPPPAG
jgi:signal transduction histidine kinase